MADIMDIDSILEDDLLDALGGLGELDNNDLDTQNNESIIEEDIPSISEKIEYEDISSNEQTISDEIQNNTSSINIDSSNIDSIATLLKELLNNKTIEITIKIK